MNLDGLNAVLDKLTMAQLNDVKRMVDMRVHAHAPAPPVPSRADFRPGDLVAFDARGREVWARVERHNPKSMGLREIPHNAQSVPGTKWRVHPSLLRLVGAGGAVPAAPKVEVRPLAGAVPNMESAGTW
jgi:hypothetical protein